MLIDISSLTFTATANAHEIAIKLTSALNSATITEKLVGFSSPFDTITQI